MDAADNPLKVDFIAQIVPVHYNTSADPEHRAVSFFKFCILHCSSGLHVVICVF
jgi:hypothetical protein